MRHSPIFFIFLSLFFFVCPLFSYSYAQYFTPKGNFGSASCTNLLGWTCDQDNYGSSLTVNVYRDGLQGSGGVYVGNVVANSFNANSAAFCGGSSNHGFVFTVPDSLKTGTPHSIYVYTHDYPAGTLFGPINGSPKTITCSLSIQGSFFSDTNLNGSWDSGESFVTGGQVTTSPASSITYPTAVTYQASNLAAGVYNVSLSTIPAGYVAYYPNNGTPPFYTVAVGNSCSTDTTHGSVCDASGNITSLRFALRQIFSIGGSVFIDNDRDGIFDAGESGYPSGTTIQLNGGTPKTTGAGGGYQYTSLFAGTYTIDMPSIPAGYVATSPSPATQNVTVGPTAGGKNFGIVPIYNISGTVNIDYDNNGTADNLYPSGATITLSGTDTYTGAAVNTTTTTNGSGVYTFSNLFAGNYTVTISSISRYTITTTTLAANVPPTASGKNFLIVPQYQISGLVFNDQSKDGVKNGAELNMSGPFTNITIVGPSGNPTIRTVTANASGYTTPITLYAGQYTISFDPAEIPTGYHMTNPPQNITPPSFVVTVGDTNPSNPPVCSASSVLGASCTAAGDIQNLNFGMTNNNPWFQCIGSSCNLPNFSNPIPASAACPGGANASIPNGTTASQPGIIFSGATADFGEGQASTANWIVDEVYAPTTTNTSYGYVTTTLRQSGITPIDLESVCTLNDCTLPADLTNGVYLANGDVTLHAYTFPAGKSYVILVNGNLRIDGEIHIPVGSSVTFSVSGDIIVNRNVGVGVGAGINPIINCSQTPNLDGFFSTDKSFIIDGISSELGPGVNTCSVFDDTLQRDQRLNITGSIVVNAAGTGGSIQNKRDLCENDRYAPSFSFIVRPDFILTSPEFIKKRSDAWREVAP